MRGSAEMRYETAYPHPGWAEQALQDWWKALLAAGRRAVEQAGCRDRDVAAMSVAATVSTMVACRADGTLLYPASLASTRSAIMPFESRAALSQASACLRSGFESQTRESEAGSPPRALCYPGQRRPAEGSSLGHPRPAFQTIKRAAN
ncbi:FGGY family carbohydrate kinase [Chelativorans intermedius]|uniref:FGGY family carbohydrate kinase n=1 Tax=Chelativorans intermedius TaxID=515947 RepID=A0ABV6D6A8_9HYPH|nr:FGGY family carbohydrate kinase [Chelativorans intermedius]MCT8999421.1 FGGY family carbohydrate kinase [Chelativorans intermedius]